MNDFVAKPVAPETLPAGAAGEPAPVGRPAAAAAAGADDDLRRQLAAIEGLDVEQGLSVVLDRADRYLHLMQLFVATHGAAAERLHRLFAAGDLDGAGRLAHSLKGAAGNLGAARVMTAAEALVAGLRRQETRLTIELAAECLAAELTTLLDGFRRVLASRMPATDDGGVGASGS